MLKELYIDNFHFVPVNKEDEVEKFICELFNNLRTIILVEQRKYVGFIDKNSSISCYDNQSGIFFLSKLSIMSALYLKYKFNQQNINEICIPILRNLFKCKINTILQT